MANSFDLGRFAAAQTLVIDQVKRELHAGEKRSHWMWFVFPQLAGLGSSAMARHYALASLAEAVAYLRHPILGPRLIECTGIVNGVQGRTAHAIFGSPDDFKFRSSMTLFGRAEPAEPAFRTALERYFEGREDPRTVALLN
jgi:uncharacterized protein (DUF1810 family)